MKFDRFGPLEILQGGWLVLCSDGLHGVMSLEEMDICLNRQPDAQGAADELVEEALARHTGDNVSVVLANWPDPSATPAPVSTDRPRGSTWKPEGILIKSPRTKPPKNKTVLASLVFLAVVASMVGLVFFLDWILSR